MALSGPAALVVTSDRLTGGSPYAPLYTLNRSGLNDKQVTVYRWYELVTQTITACSTGTSTKADNSLLFGTKVRHYESESRTCGTNSSKSRDWTALLNVWKFSGNAANCSDECPNAHYN